MPMQKSSTAFPTDSTHTNECTSTTSETVAQKGIPSWRTPYQPLIHEFI